MVLKRLTRKALGFSVLRLRTFLVRSPKGGELLGLEWGMTIQVSNIIFPDENSGVRCYYYKGVG